MPVTIEQELVTPELASEWLEYNKKNRNERYTEVLRYTGDMANGQWWDTGDTVKFDTDGILADGQHRLDAIIKSNEPQMLWVARGLDPRARRAIDDGRPRRFADDLQMNEVPSSLRIEALVRKIMMWETYQALLPSGGMPRIPRGVLADCYEKNVKEITTALEVSQEHKNVPCSMPVCDFVTYLLLKAAPLKMVNKYLQTVHIGSLDDNDMPLNTLRDRMVRENIESAQRGRRASTPYMVWLMLRAWNAWVTGEKSERLMLPRGGLRKGITFPIPVTVEYKEEKHAPRRA